MDPLNSIAYKLPDRKERMLQGRSLRKLVGRVEQSEWKPGKKRPDPVALIAQSNRGRMPRLVPIKMARMAASPFGFFRGAVALMAADLATLPVTGLHAQICGDAHVRNFGAYAAPDGRLVFDINDFDETITAPWEWDVKRLATSLVLAGRESTASESDCMAAVMSFAQSYRSSVVRFSNLPILDLEKYEVERSLRLAPVAHILRQAAHATPEENLQKLTIHRRDGVRTFLESKPLMERVHGRIVRQVLGALKTYREVLSAERRQLLSHYRPADVAFKVVGTGCVGMRDYVVLLFGNGTHDPLFLQLKEEKSSAYTRFLADAKPFLNEGQRVVEGQRRMQTSCDPFLGWTKMEGRDYLVRQLRDHKASVELEKLTGQNLLDYARVCGELLAKGHARSGEAVAMAGYVGASDKLDHAITKFALAYADQTSKDYDRFRAAVKAGKVRVARAGTR